jgi:L-threonylcarbamoyladenylate synthase
MAIIGKDLAYAKELLLRGELVAIPTETVYGLAGNALDSQAVIKIFTVKNRPQFDPLIVHVANPAQAETLVETIPSVAKELMTRYWPGPLTFLLQKKQVIPDLVTAGLDTVGIRCPDHPLTHALLSSLDFPLAAPSANPFGYVSPTTPDHVNAQLGNQVKYILDGGPCRVGLESTIIGFDNEPTIYRLGGLGVEEIEKVIGPVKIDLNTSSNPKAPGQLRSHYAPRKKLIITNLNPISSSYATASVGVLAFKQYATGVNQNHQVVLSPDGNLEEAAKNLFSALRKLDTLDIELILAEPVPDYGLGKAINDRLRRAAA